MHDFGDREHWRGLTIDQLLIEVAEQIEPQQDGSRVDDDYARSVALDALATVIEDTIDRAEDMAHCAKVDECRAKAVFLAWLAWNLDHELMPEGVR
jgi:frataxin-like iron-binding protein CyaY